MRDQIQLTGRNRLLVIPEPDSVGGGVDRACAVHWAPVGRVCRPRVFGAKFRPVEGWTLDFSTVSRPNNLLVGLALPRQAHLCPVKKSI